MQVKLASWNINGIRAAIKKDFWPTALTLKPDIFCLQEIKAGTEIMNNLGSLLNYQPYKLHSHSSTIRKGYSGVATFSLAKTNTKPSDTTLFVGNSEELKPKLTLTDYQIGLGIDKFDQEGRVVITNYKIKNGVEFVLINAYYPQGGRGQFRIDYKLDFYQAVLSKAQELKQAGHKVILCGDFNTTVADIDLARPKENRKTTGCLPEEREALNYFFQAGFVDSFRHFHPTETGKYTYWDQITRARDRNVGWRIDYFLVDDALLDSLKEATIHEQILGSDHCPVSVVLEF